MSKQGYVYQQTRGPLSDGASSRSNENEHLAYQQSDGESGEGGEGGEDGDDAGAGAESEDEYEDDIDVPEEDDDEDDEEDVDPDDYDGSPSGRAYAASPHRIAGKLSPSLPDEEDQQEEEVTSLAQGVDVGPDPGIGPLGSRRMKLASETGDIRELLPYPADPRSIRHFDYDCRPMSRLSKMPHLYYGRKKAPTVQAMFRRWCKHFILPSKFVGGSTGCMIPPWVSDDVYAASKQKLQYLHKSFRQYPPTTIPMPQKEAEKYVWTTNSPMLAKLGYESNTELESFRPGQSILINAAGLPIHGDETGSVKSEGLLFDVGGIVPDMGWAPRDGYADQFLLLSVIPFKDEVVWDNDRHDFSTGCLQLWKFPSQTCQELTVELPPRPVLTRFICSDWGRINRLKWCPVPLEVDGVLGLVAVLCGDGTVRVLEIHDEGQSKETEYVKVVNHVAIFSLDAEQHIWPTSFSWVNSNRICIGHMDGSLTLWSIHPNMMLQRHLAHHCQILDLVSAYPSHPTIVCVVPISGCVSILDLHRPTSETTSIAIDGTNFQPHLLDWNDHLQCFIAPSPTIASINTTLGLFNIRYFPSFRNAVALKTFPMSVSVGAVHPFILAGDSAGSVWACNAIHRLLPNKGLRPHKMRILAHEHRPPGTLVEDDEETEGGICPDNSSENRGSVRILTGFLPEPNLMPKTEVLLDLIEKGAGNLKMKSKSERSMMPPYPKRGRGRSTARPPPKAVGMERKATPMPTTGVIQGNGAKSGKNAEVETEAGGDVVPDGETLQADTGKYEFPEGLVQEGRSRITKIQWNPNLVYGHWAAIAMGSGLVRIMDLGVEY